MWTNKMDWFFPGKPLHVSLEYMSQNKWAHLLVTKNLSFETTAHEVQFSKTEWIWEVSVDIGNSIHRLYDEEPPHQGVQKGEVSL